LDVKEPRKWDVKLPAEMPAGFNLGGFSVTRTCSLTESRAFFAAVGIVSFVGLFFLDFLFRLEPVLNRVAFVAALLYI
jgi:hypothetical protein